MIHCVGKKALQQNGVVVDFYPAKQIQVCGHEKLLEHNRRLEKVSDKHSPSALIPLQKK
jgi:hypothetical protein